jgi:hypothetical protein
VDVPPKHNPTPEERDERVKLPLEPEMAIEAIMATGLHRDEDDAPDEAFFFVTSHSTHIKHGPYESQAEAEEVIAAPLLGDTESWTIQVGARMGTALRSVRTGRGPLG